MSTVKELAKVYEALMSIKMLQSNVRLDLRVPARMTLLLAMAVDQALSGNDPGNTFRKLISEEDQGKLVELTMEILKKGELEEFYQKLKELGQG